MARFEVDAFTLRAYDPVWDVKSVHRIWHECGWHRDADIAAIEDFHSVGDAYVAALDEIAECVAHVVPGTIRYQDQDLSLCAVMTVVTSHIARKRGLGKRIAAHAIARAASGGAEVAALGMFEQGYYDQLGFGCGSYEQLLAFDPSDLKVTVEPRIPRRLTKQDWADMAHALQHRWVGHGGCVLFPPEIVRAQTALQSGGFGLGYFDEQGELTHFFFATLNEGQGPLHVVAMAYQNGHQLLELLALLRSLGDQISMVSMVEPPHLQLQDVLRRPFRFRRISQGSPLENYHQAASFWQFRILDLEQCLRRTHLSGRAVEFNLILTDPIGDYLDATGAPWTGIGGEFTIRLGEASSAGPGTDSKLPTLCASVNAFSRLWFGIRPASQLAISDDITAPDELLEALDATIRLPSAAWGWYFQR